MIPVIFRWFFCTGLFVHLMVIAFQSPGEGIKQLRPDSTVSAADLYFYNSTSSFYTKFGLINCPPNYRLYIHVRNAGESILFGLKSPNPGLKYNLKKPDGTIALTGYCPVITSDIGYISFYKQAIKGPFISIGGYNPLEYKILNIADTGNYYFEINNLSNNNDAMFTLWDFQVVNGQHTPAILADTVNGRVYSQSWQLYAALGYNLFSGFFHVYSDDGIVTKLKFTSASVGAVTIFCNPYGCYNTGNFLNDRKSEPYSTYQSFPGIAQYKVFLNNPDSVCYPSGVNGQIMATPLMIPDPGFSPCSGNEQIVVNVNKSGRVEVDLSFPYGGTATNVQLYSVVNPGNNYIPWNGKDGLGNPVPDGTMINGIVNYLNGLTNLPIWDQEQNPNGFRISLVRPQNPTGSTPTVFWDDSAIPPGSGCPTGTELTGCQPAATGCHIWSGIDCHDRMINTWWYGSTSTASFTAMFFSTPPVAIPHDSARCGNGFLTLHVTVLPVETADWYAIPTGGTPLLINDTMFQTSYLTATTTFYAEVRNPVSGCRNSVRTPVVAAILPVPVPTISGPEKVCFKNPVTVYSTESGMNNYQWTISPGGQITAGSVTDSITVTWIAPGSQTITVNYKNSWGCEGLSPAILRILVIPDPGSAGPISGADSVCAGTSGILYTVAPISYTTIYYWTVPFGASVVAGSGTDSVTIDFDVSAVSGNIYVNGSNMCGDGPFSPPFPVTVNRHPSASAGPDDVCCQDHPYLVSHAVATNYFGLQWSTSGAGNLLNSTTLSPKYIPAPGEIGNIILKLVAKGYFPCPDDSSLMVLAIVPGPVVNAGADLSTCQTDPIQLTGSSASGYQSLSWISSGNGTFSDPSALHPFYFPGPGDTIIKKVTLTLIATAVPPCTGDTGYLQLTLADKATANAGDDASVCEGVPFVPLNSQANNFTVVEWKTTGDGNFDDPQLLHPSYLPGTNDLLTGNVALILHAYSSAPCVPATDTLILSIAKAPVADAGPDKTTCTGHPVIIDEASALNYLTISWTHNGSGILTGENSLSPAYYPSGGETGTVTLVLTVGGNGACTGQYTTDQVNLYLDAAIIADAGPDQTIAYQSATILQASTSSGSGQYVYNWQPASLVTDNTIQNPMTVQLTGDTSFIVTITDLVTGCRNSDTIRIRVLKGNQETECIVIPNVITPNGDGLNDSWIIGCIEQFPDNSVQIFDRWGDEVNRFDHYDNVTRVWKGTNIHGDLLPDGTYYYVLNIKNHASRTGWVFIRGGNR